MMAGVPGLAQDSMMQMNFDTTGQIMAGIANTAAMNNVLRNAYGNGDRDFTGSPPRGGRLTEGYRSRSASAPSIAPGQFSYRPSPGLSRAALNGYVARIRRHNPEAADITARELGRYDITRIYRGIVQPFGLRDGDAGDALTAYTVLGWLVATGAGDPSPRAVAALRSQLAPRLANGALAGKGAAELGGEFKLLFVTMHAGWQSARREGNLRQYSDGVAALFQRQGTDLRALRLTERGFVGR